MVVVADRAGHRWRLRIQGGDLAVRTEGANPEGRAVWVPTDGALRARGAELEAALPELRGRWASVVDPVVESLAAVEGGFLATIGGRVGPAWRDGSAHP